MTHKKLSYERVTLKRFTNLPKSKGKQIPTPPWSARPETMELVDQLVKVLPLPTDWEGFGNNFKNVKMKVYFFFKSFVCPLYVPYMSLICPLYVPYMSLICPLYIPCISLVCPLYVPCMSLLCPFYVPCICTLHVLILVVSVV